MTKHAYPFSALVGLDTVKTALLLAAVDERLGVLLRGEKGSGKTTAARALARLLPEGAPFVDLPVGATEDRVIGGLDLARAMKGEPALQPGLLSQADGGLLYIDEVNLLPDHLVDALLDTAASGVNVVEREGFSESHSARFILVGSMNPEEGSLRPQLLDRFALAVDVIAPPLPEDRRLAVERRLAYDADAAAFVDAWRKGEQSLRARVESARRRRPSVSCAPPVVEQASVRVCREGVTSLRADLAVIRAAVAFAALDGRDAVRTEDIETVLPLALAHRRRRPPADRSVPPPPPPPSPPAAREDGGTCDVPERIFPVADVGAPRVVIGSAEPDRSARPASGEGRTGPILRARRSDAPIELHARATVVHAVARHGDPLPRVEDLHEAVRGSARVTRYLFVVDASGSHAAHRRMELVKGVVQALLEASTRSRDEVCLITFRGSSAEVLLEPTRDPEAARRALAHLPTGGRTPLAHALELAVERATDRTVVILVTDGRANVPSRTADAWADALSAARAIRRPALVVDSETGPDRLRLAAALGEAMGAVVLPLDELSASHVVRLGGAQGVRS